MDLQINDQATPQLQAAAAGIEAASAQAAEESLTALVIPSLQVYPPAPPRAYRTGAYGAGFYTKVDGPGAYLENQVPYATFLGSENQTAPAAAIGWRKWADVISDHLEEIKARFADKLSALFGK